MKNRLTTLLLFLILLLGVAILLYPTVSDYWNSFHQSRAIASYVEEVASVDPMVYEYEWQKAIAYNEALAQKENRWILDEEEQAEYNAVLNLNGSGIMGYIEVPKIGCALPIYHGTDEAVLQIAIGHVEGSSLPTGGLGTHCVVSGHRGLPSAKLFTDLDQLIEGDVFIMRVLNEVLTYEVDQVLIVLPHELEALAIDPEKDYCTLVTCTPYGINSHRLLVRGHRIANASEAKTILVPPDAKQIDTILIMPIVAAPMLIVLFFYMMSSTRHIRRRNRDRREARERVKKFIR